MIVALVQHWPQYLAEGILLGAFMISACVCSAAVLHERSRYSRLARTPVARRAFIGLLMGLTAIVLIYSPLGRSSGAHMNPATTLTFLVLGRIEPWDALFYGAAQLIGGLAGVRLAAAILGPLVTHEPVRYAATLPGRHGRGAAWLAEFGIAGTLMSVVLVLSNSPGLAPFTGLAAGALVAAFITMEAPLSGMSMNPARTLASAIPAREFRGLWIYLTAPVAGMLGAAGMYTVALGPDCTGCATLNHPRTGPCALKCRMPAAASPESGGGIQAGAGSALSGGHPGHPNR
jgi:aquaporin Z